MVVLMDLHWLTWDYLCLIHWFIFILMEWCLTWTSNWNLFSVLPRTMSMASIHSSTHQWTLGKRKKTNKNPFTVNCFLVVCGSSLNIITNRCCGYRVLCVLQAHAGWILFDVGHMNQRFQFKSIPSEDMTMSSMAVVESNANTEENRPSTSFVTTLCR